MISRSVSGWLVSSFLIIFLVSFLLLISPLLLVGGLYIRWHIKKVTRDLLLETKDLSRSLTEIKTKVAGGNSLVESGLVLDIADYQSIKESQELWYRLENILARVSTEMEGEELSVPTWLTSFLSPLVDFYLAFRAYNLQHVQVLELFDSCSPEGEYFQTRSEQELWANRARAYEYLI